MFLQFVCIIVKTLRTLWKYMEKWSVCEAKASVDFASATISAEPSTFHIKLDQIVLNTIAGHLSCPIGKLFTFELINSNFARALFCAYQQYQCLRIVEKDPSPCAAQLGILKRHNLKFYSLQSLNENTLLDLSSIFSRFPQITSLQTFSEFGSMKENVVQILETMTKRSIDKIKTLSVSHHKNDSSLCIPELLHQTLSKLIIFDSKQLRGAEFLEITLKKLNLEYVELNHFSISDNDWLFRAFAHMSNLRCLQMDPKLFFPTLANPKTFEVVSRLDVLRIVANKYKGHINYLKVVFLPLINNDALKFLQELREKTKVKVTFNYLLSPYPIETEMEYYFTEQELANRMEAALDLSYKTCVSVLFCVKRMNRKQHIDIDKVSHILKQKFQLLVMENNTALRWCRFQTEELASVKLRY